MASWAFRRLQGSWLFHDLPAQALEHLERQAVEVTLREGDVLLKEGDRADALYVVIDGVLGVTQSSSTGTVVLGEVRRGEHVGELALLENAPRAATVTASTPTRVLEVTRASFEACVREFPQAASALRRLTEYRRAWAGVRRVRPSVPEVVVMLAKVFPEVPSPQLAALADEVEWVTVPTGAVLFRGGEAGDALYFVVRGGLDVVAQRDDGQDVRLGEVVPGEPVGEMALLSNEPRMGTARANADSELIKLSRTGFEALVSAHPAAMALFARSMATRLARAARGRGAISQLCSARIVSLDDCTSAVSVVDPVMLNLSITQLYHRIAVDLTLLLGAQDANWFCFGCRASKTAGASIRLEELPLRDVLQRTPFWPLLTRGLERTRRTSLVRVFDDTLQTVADRVALGNRFIFKEIGPAFVQFVSAFAKEQHYDRAKLEAVLARFKAGPSDRGGQDTLKGALTAYYEAAFERSAKRRSELVLLGSLKVGLHEQTRVDPILDDALDAPLEVFFDQLAGHVPRPVRVVARRARPLVQRQLRAFLTRRLMRMRLPDVTLDLGGDVPSYSPQRQFPPALETLEHPELRTLYGSFTAGARSAARDWTSLADRMRYIATLFRTRQKSLQLFEPPYLEEQGADITARRIPAGAL
jgi:CRP-like cAMP-binding protein